MKYLFEYNWKVRDEWLNYLVQVPKKELIKKRIGGLESIQETLFHIVKVEHNWIRDLKNESISSLTYDAKTYNLDTLKRISDEFRQEVKGYIDNWDGSKEFKSFHLSVGKNEIRCTYGEALRHIIAHEIHHIGQLSIWLRELGLPPISSNLIHKNIMPRH